MRLFAANKAVLSTGTGQLPYRFGKGGNSLSLAVKPPVSGVRSYPLEHTRFIQTHMCTPAHVITFETNTSHSYQVATVMENNL